MSEEKHDNVIAPPPVIWIVLIALGYLLGLWQPLPFVPATDFFFWLGILIWFFGFVLAVLAFLQFRNAGTDVRPNTETSAIVDTGVYAFSRNPIYLGGVIGIAGFAIALNNFWILLMIVPYILIISYGVINREEAYLEKRFGETYLDYKKRVRRWV